MNTSLHPLFAALMASHLVEPDIVWLQMKEQVHGKCVRQNCRSAYSEVYETKILRCGDSSALGSTSTSWSRVAAPQHVRRRQLEKHFAMNESDWESVAASCLVGWIKRGEAVRAPDMTASNLVAKFSG